MTRMAAVEQPDEPAEGEEQNGPGMHRSEGEHGEDAEKHGKDGPAGASEAGHPCRGTIQVCNDLG